MLSFPPVGTEHGSVSELLVGIAQCASTASLDTSDPDRVTMFSI